MLSTALISVYKSTLNRPTILLTQTKLNLLINAKRHIFGVYCYKRLLLVERIKLNNGNTNVAQKREFKRRDIFGHAKGRPYLETLPGERLVVLFIGSTIILGALDKRGIWEHYLPDWFKEPVAKKFKEIHAYLKKILRAPDVKGLEYDSNDGNNDCNDANGVNGVNDATNDALLNSIQSHPKSTKTKKSKSGFRDRKIIEYENRIRMYSTPDKVFRYFASIKIIYDQNESEIYMTPDDFLRALTPGVKQPDGLGLDQFKRIDLKTKDEETDLSALLSQILLTGNKNLAYGLKADSIFYRLSNYGLINFSDFLFLLTVISVSRRNFEIAFRMFDLNGDGNVEYEEFERVQNAILRQTSIGKKIGASSKVGYKDSYYFHLLFDSSDKYEHRSTSDNKRLQVLGVSSALAKYFFGEDLKQKLTTEKFLDFQRQLQTELLTLEFQRKKPDPTTNRISETEFAELLIAFAGLSEKKKEKMIRRVRKKFSHKMEENEEEMIEYGISLDEYLRLFSFLQNINDVDIALTMFHIAGASIDRSTLKHVAKTVAHVELNDHLVDVLFTLFDENQDGHLSNREFTSVMKERLRRGLAKPKDTGFLKLLHAIWNSLKFDFGYK